MGIASLMYHKKKSNNVAPVEGTIYGIKIDTTNSSPEGAVTYVDNAIGSVPASGNNGFFNGGSWLDKFPFNQIKPCLFKDGVVQYYLNPNDYTKKEDGSPADITSGADGNVMIEFPKIYWNIKKIGTEIYIRYSDKRISEQYKCWAHMRGTTEKDKVYISAYLGNLSNGVLQSLSGKAPVVSQTITALRNASAQNGENYQQMGYYQVLMLQILYLVMFKDRNSQSALGSGYATSNASRTTTGKTNTKGLYFGETTGKQNMKLFGIEDVWGNARYFADGIYLSESLNMFLGTHNFNDDAVGYTNVGVVNESPTNSYTVDIIGTTELGFLPLSSGGTATTYYCDRGGIVAKFTFAFGSPYNASVAGGIFQITNTVATATPADISARLVYL